MSTIPRLAAGEQVKFDTDRRWWRVRAGDARWTILTRQAPFKPKGDVVYTIIDRAREVRGPCNALGQGWAFGPDSLDDDAARLLAALRRHVERDAWICAQIAAGEKGPWPIGGQVKVEVSYRNNVPVQIVARKGA